MQVERGMLESLLSNISSGGRVSNTWETCPSDWDNFGKPELILDMTCGGIFCVWKDLSVRDELAAYQLVGGVMAYQGDDG